MLRNVMTAVNQSHISVTYHESQLEAVARTLATELDLPLHPPGTAAANTYLLTITQDGIGLTDTNSSDGALFSIDFLSKSWQYRVKHASLKNEFVARAMGTPAKDHPTIIDATAGLGRDSFILASLGYHIISLERSAIVFALLRDALKRAAQLTTFQPILERLQLIHVDAIDYLPTRQADIIYLDPMFPSRKKSASVKKELSFLQAILGHDRDTSNLLDLSLSCAAKRVVVKRPRLAEPLNQHPPHFTYEGKSSRFDVYLTNQGASR